MDVLGVDLLSIELLGRLLDEELLELKVVKFMRTLCGLCFNFCIVVGARRSPFGGLSEDLGGEGLSSFVGGTTDRLDDAIGLPVIFEPPAYCPSSSECCWSLIRFGDGDLEEVIHDFRANVANDSDTDFVLLSRTALEI